MANLRHYKIKIEGTLHNSSYIGDAMLTEQEHIDLDQQCLQMELAGKIKHDWYIYSPYSGYRFKDVMSWLTWTEGKNAPA